MKSKSKVNAVVIGSHHGCFLTLQSIRDHLEDFEKVVVLVPNTQLEKYSKMAEPIFNGFESHLKKYMKKNIPDANSYVIQDPNFLHAPVLTVSVIMNELHASGIWIVIQAGAIYNGMTGKWNEEVHSTKMESCILGFTNYRSYDMSPKYNMYNMIGAGDNLPLERKFNKQTFLLNMDNLKLINGESDGEFIANLKAPTNYICKLNQLMFTRSDELFGVALPEYEVCAHGAHSVKSLCMQYWVNAMTHIDDLRIEDLHAAPLDIYAAIAKKVKRLLPADTYKKMVTNGKECVSATSKIRDIILFDD